MDTPTSETPSTVHFVMFTEDNDWEGETWNFWLQHEGNEVELEKLQGFLEKIHVDSDDPADAQCTLNMDVVEPEENVDLLVRYAEGGYMPTHNKVTGTLTAPVLDDYKGADDDSTVVNAQSALYKGGIRDFFKKETG